MRAQVLVDMGSNRREELGLTRADGQPGAPPLRQWQCSGSCGGHKNRGWRTSCQICGRAAPPWALAALARRGTQEPAFRSAPPPGGMWGRGPPGSDMDQDSGKVIKEAVEQAKKELQQEPRQALLGDPLLGLSEVQQRAITLKMGGAQAEEVEKPADLRSKTLQDLLQRVKKREKQVVNTTERVREAREAADAAAKALRDEEALLARHQASLKELKQIVKDKEIAEAVPVLGQTAATLGLAGVDQALAVIHQLSETLSQFEAMPGLATFAGQLRTSVTEQRQGIAQQQQQAQVAEAAREEAEAKLAADRGAAAAAAPAAGAEPGGGEAMAVDGGGLDVDLDDPDLASKLKEAGLGEFDLSQEADREKVKRAQDLLVARLAAGAASVAHGTQCGRVGGGGGAPTAPHVVLLQEHRLKEPRLVDSARKWASQGGLNSVFGHAESTGGKANQSSSGVAVLSSLPLLDGFGALQEALPRSRFQVGVVSTGLGVPVYFISLYLTTKVGLTEPNLTHLERLLGGIAGLQGPWVVGGDWNLEPAEVQEWARLAQGVAVAPDIPSCEGRVLDFFVVSRVLGNFVRSVDVVDGTAIRTHVPVMLRLHGLHAEAKVTRAVLPTAYPIVLPPPTRPAPPEVGDSAWPWEAGGFPSDLHAATLARFQRAEAYLSCLHGSGSRKEGRCHGLREQRAPFVTEWQSQLKARTSAEYRCWAGLLAACQRACSLQAIMRSRRWSRYSALNRQLKVINSFVIEDGWWPQSGALANMSVEKMLKVFGSDSASASSYLLRVMDDHVLSL
ncbi:unnamed protein product, partial [Prorocentrum cordatum]